MWSAFAASAFGPQLIGSAVAGLIIFMVGWAALYRAVYRRHRAAQLSVIELFGRLFAWGTAPTVLGLWVVLIPIYVFSTATGWWDADAVRQSAIDHIVMGIAFDASLAIIGTAVMIVGTRPFF